MRLFRLFQLLDELRLRRNAVPARTLALDLGVSLRTLYRDIADLQAMGAPIRGEGGVGYLIEPGYFMPSLRLDEDELSALALGVRLVAARADPGMSEAARRAAAKLASAVGEDARRELLDSSFEAGPSDAANAPHLGVLRDAIRQRKVLEIDYKSIAGQPSTRLARPLGLTVFDSVWLLTIWCETAQSFRHLRVDRIGDIRVTTQRFRDERGQRFSDCLALEGYGSFLHSTRQHAQQGAPPDAPAAALLRQDRRLSPALGGNHQKPRRNLVSQSEQPRPPFPPFDEKSAKKKVRLVEDAWNSRDPERASLAYTPNTVWRNRAEFLSGREAVVKFLSCKWSKELEYRLIKELWAFHQNRIAVRFAYEWRDNSGNWYRSYGNENWEFNESGFMHRRMASINDLPINESERKFHWPQGRRPDEHPGLSELGL